MEDYPSGVVKIVINTFSAAVYMHTEAIVLHDFHD